jgi:hypothetical protein
VHDGDVAGGITWLSRVIAGSFHLVIVLSKILASVGASSTRVSTSLML